MWIDSHCHLNHTKFTPENGVAGVVQDAKAQGVEGMLSINCQIREEFAGLLELVKPLDSVWCTVGTHPHESGRDDEKSVSVEELAALAISDDKVIGIGECGLDYFYKHSQIDEQQACFRKHIRACLAVDKPIIIHARDADDAVRGRRRGGALMAFADYVARVFGKAAVWVYRIETPDEVFHLTGWVYDGDICGLSDGF